MIYAMQYVTRLPGIAAARATYSAKVTRTTRQSNTCSRTLHMAQTKLQLHGYAKHTGIQTEQTAILRHESMQKLVSFGKEGVKSR